MKEYSIQELSEEGNVPRRTIHFYIQQGILPGPDGAGLGAKYGEKHLLLLQLIPILRQQGNRLDDIRAIFSSENEQALRAMYENYRDAVMAKPRATAIGRTYSHYALPEDMTLIVPASMSSANRKKLAALLQAVSVIFDDTIEIINPTNKEE